MFTIRISLSREVTEIPFRLLSILKAIVSFPGPLVKSNNFLGDSEYSEIWSFTTGFPASPQLLEPGDLTVDLVLDPIIKWAGRDDAVNYQLQVFEDLGANPEKIIVDSLMTDTTWQSIELKPFTVYSWRVKVTNNIGASLWADVFGNHGDRIHGREIALSNVLIDVWLWLEN